MKNKVFSIISVILALVITFSANFFVFAEEVSSENQEESTEHIHSRELISLPVDEVEGISVCGYFYCQECGEYYYDTMTTEDLGMPIINFTGSFKGMTKDKKVTVGVFYSDDDQEFSCNATLKWQGSSSLGYDKKNYTMNLLKEDGSKNKVCFNDEWGKQSKYCLKANYVDYSASRNVVSAKIFGQIVKSRNKGDKIESLVNGGAIDGYPVVIYHDDVFLGLYTLNIPKDDWLFDMGNENALEAIFFGDDWSESVALREPVAINPSDSCWDIEYCSTEDNELIGTLWIRDSFNEFIEFINNCTQEEFNEHINEYTDIDRAIDLFIYTVFLHAGDNVSKNIIWATYDGVKWIPSAYDLDGTWGNRYDGEFAYNANDFSFKSYNNLYDLILKYKKAELVKRYIELREDILSIDNIKNQFSSFFALIPDFVYEAEAEKWPDQPSIEMNNYDQIINFATNRVNYLDNLLGVRIVEKPSLSNKVTFTSDENTTVSVFSGIDLTQQPENKNIGWCVNSKSGVYTKRNGIIYFEVAPEEGYSVGEIICADPDCTILTPEDTGVENVYAIKGVNKTTSVSVNSDALPVEAYSVSFDVPDGVEVTVYATKEDTVGEVTYSAYSVDGDTGIPVNNGDGQVNFSLSFADGVEFDSIVVTPIEGFKSLKGPDETGKENNYRITKITQDLTVKVYSEGEPAPENEGYLVTFNYADNINVSVYPGQNYSMDATPAYRTYSVNPISGEPTADGSGQVNFRLDLPEYTEIKSVEISPENSYKELKTPDETGYDNIFRITKINSDITVTIITETHQYNHSYVPSSDDPANCHYAYCECGLFITESHSFSEPVIKAEKAVILCKACGFTKDFILGDTDDDGKVDVNDARLALRISVGLDNVNNYTINFLLTDIDGDNKITVADARYILRAAVGLEKDLLSLHPEIKDYEEITLPEETTEEDTSVIIPVEEETSGTETDEDTTEESTTVEETTTDSIPEESTTVIDEPTTTDDATETESTTVSEETSTYFFL